VMSDLQKSDTLWLDPGISALVRIGDFRVTQEVTVQRIEYLTEFASLYPILETPTAIVIDAQDAKFDFRNKHGNLRTVDAIIKNKVRARASSFDMVLIPAQDNDSWEGGTGTGDTTVYVTYEPGKDPILSRRSRLDIVFRQFSLRPGRSEAARCRPSRSGSGVA